MANSPRVCKGHSSETPHHGAQIHFSVQHQQGGPTTGTPSWQQAVLFPD